MLARRSELAGQLNAARLQERDLVERWLASRQNPPQAVSTDKLVLRLRLDEGGGEVLKNSAPNAHPASFAIGKSKPQWGETTWLWPDFRMDASTRVMLGQTGDYDSNQPFSLGGWFMLRSAPNYSVEGTSGTLISKMDSTQHNRGWEIAIEKGILIVDLVNEEPKEQAKPKKAAAKKGAQTKEPFDYPTPTDLTAKDLAPNKPPHKKEAHKKEAAEKKESQKAGCRGGPDTTPLVAIKISTVDRLPLDGEWKHLFFTYDGSGKASGVKIYVNGLPVATRVDCDALGHKTIRTQAPMQLGWRYPDANPAQETRYQDLRLYGRALTAEEAKRLPFEDYVAEMTSKPASQWNEDQWHVVSQFYLNNVDTTYQARSRARSGSWMRSSRSSPRAAT